MVLTIVCCSRSEEQGKQCKLRFGHKEVRFHGVSRDDPDSCYFLNICHHHLLAFNRAHQAPFALYPGEVMSEGVKAQPIIPSDHAIRLTAILEHTADDGSVHALGDIWQLYGPLTYDRALPALTG